MAYDTTDRAALHAYLSPEAHHAWQTYSEANGVSVTALLESLGLELRNEMVTTEPDEMRQPWIRIARRIDAERRRRGRER